VLSGYITTLFLKKQAETRRFERRPFVNITTQAQHSIFTLVLGLPTLVQTVLVYISEVKALRLRNVH
jgi:hypothetical protein